MTTTSHQGQDLSLVHHPVGHFLHATPTPDSLSEYRAKYALTDEDLQYFKENGYLSNIPALTDEQVDQLIKELETLQHGNHPNHSLCYEFSANETNDPNNVLFHCLGHWRITEGFHDLAWHPAILYPASQLLGGLAIRFWHDQLFCKPPKHGGCVAWHQDYSYWTRTVPQGHLTIHIALDDQTVENGCLHYIPGSHRWPLLPIIETFQQHGVDIGSSDRRATRAVQANTNATEERTGMFPPRIDSSRLIW
eukprot:TRINITY_DN2104_c0_g1_i1.p1 TRINITY_DN2104_c0_g1~~TRINITY_DN2104_c0_g1_i1.p1  ORF type:complete len:250 (+),score=24.38 TRINITY_DN2104_c0_g1_i1:102-851(+)